MKKIETLEFLEKEKQKMRLCEIIAFVLLYIFIVADNIDLGIGRLTVFIISAVCVVGFLVTMTLYSISRHVIKNAMKETPQFWTALNNEMYRQYKLKAYRNGAITFMTVSGLFYIFANELPVAPRIICATILFSGGLAITISEYIQCRS